MSLEDKFYFFQRFFDALPFGVKRMVGRLYQGLPVSLTIGKKYPLFKEMLIRTEFSDRTYFYKYQNQEFLKTIQAAKKTEFYPKFYRENGVDINSITSLEDIKKLPVIDKGILQRFREEMVVKENTGQKLYLTTGGSTGIPVGFYLQKGVTRAKELAFMENQWERAGYRRGDRCAVIRGLVVSSGAKGEILKIDPFRNWMLLSSYHLSEERIGEYIDHLNSFQPKFIQGYPSALDLLCRLVRKKKLNLSFAPYGVLAASENLYWHQKTLIEETFNSKIFSWYGHAERVILGGYCEKSNFFHIFPQYGFTELLDGRNQTILSGCGQLTGTSFHNSVMPLIRYKTSDLGTLHNGKCPCGRNYLLLEKIDGRLQELVVTSTGRRISMTAINMHSDIFEKIKQFQFTQREIGKVIFSYVPLLPLERKDLIRIQNELLVKFGDDVELSLQQVSIIPPTPNGKHRFLIQELSNLNEQRTIESRS